MYQIDHVVVLMLENRSFDCMLGRLRPHSDRFDGVPLGAKNIANGKSYPAWTSGTDDSNQFIIPKPDPNEQFDHMTAQIFGAGQPSNDSSKADMSGFAADYASIAGADPASVMHGFAPEQVPVLSALANGFAVSDRWFASAPCQTWPNRFFAHTGTARGYVNNSPIHPPYMMESVFNRLSNCDRSWRIYFHDMPQCATLTRLWSSLPEHLYSFEDYFMADAMAGRLPNYSFIEPRYFADPLVNRMPNDQHPPHDVALGERLIARCYDAIRNGAGWERTLFIITFDEHGGIWDHVPPPSAVSPDGYRDGSGFAFDRYGVRVPAVLVSPWIAPGTVLRPPAGGYPFDHTSIIATLNRLFGPFDPLTERDRLAPDLLDCLNLSAATNSGPRSIPLPVPKAAAPEITSAQMNDATDAQNAMAAMADALSSGTANIPEHQANLARGAVAYISSEVKRSASDALSIAEDGLSRLLHGTGAN